MICTTWLRNADFVCGTYSRRFVDIFLDRRVPHDRRVLNKYRTDAVRGRRRTLVGQCLDLGQRQASVETPQTRRRTPLAIPRSSDWREVACKDHWRGEEVRRNIQLEDIRRSTGTDKIDWHGVDAGSETLDGLPGTCQWEWRTKRRRLLQELFLQRT